MLPLFRSSVSRALALRPHACRIARQLTSRRSFAVAGRALEDHQTPASCVSAEDKIETKWYERLESQMEKQQQERQERLERFLHWQAERRDKHDAEKREVYGTIIKERQEQQLERFLQWQGERQDKHDAETRELYETIIKQAKRTTALANISSTERKDRLKLQQTFNVQPLVRSVRDLRHV